MKPQRALSTPDWCVAKRGCDNPGNCEWIGACAAGASMRKDRKGEIELVLRQAQRLDDDETAQAWRRLCRELGHLTHPESRMPRFKALLHALWIAASNDQT